jgi:CspA family cold shock protein
MKKSVLLPAMLFAASVMMISCENKKANDKNGGTAEIENTDLVSSGSYTGTAKEVDPKEQEIYVETGDGKILELYFNETTKLTRGGTVVPFGELKKGNSLEVTVENNGNSLKPIEVKILD